MQQLSLGRKKNHLYAYVMEQHCTIKKCGHDSFHRCIMNGFEFIQCMRLWISLIDHLFSWKVKSEM